jgi:hypothetical protein
MLNYVLYVWAREKLNMTLIVQLLRPAMDAWVKVG